jgi:hypothetical protein
LACHDLGPVHPLTATCKQLLDFVGTDQQLSSVKLLIETAAARLIQIKAQAGLWKCNILSWHFGRMIMAIQIVMDHTGDSRHPFNPNDAQALAKAEKRFQELTGVGFTAAVRTASGEVSRVRSFDPTAEETLFFPRLVGG